MRVVSSHADSSRRGHRVAAALAALALVGLVVAARADAYVYWGNQVLDGSFPGAVGRANLDGSGVDQQFIPGGESTCGPAVDGEHVFWANRGDSQIGRANLDGTSPQQGFISTGTSLPCGVAVDGTHVFWANGGVADSIGRANLEGTSPDNSFIAAEDPLGVAVDATHVFWANGDGAGFGSVGRANLDGTGVDQQFVPVDPANEIRGVAVNSTHVFWADRTGDRIGRALLDGTDVEEDFIPTADPCGVAVSDTHVYWANQAAGTIARAQLDGTEVEEDFIAATDNGPCGVAVDQLPSTTDATVSCSPSSVAVSQATTCTATVEDSSASPTTPTGAVEFTSGGAGSFSADDCTLAETTPGEASCAVTYTPTQVGSGSHQITGSYEGDNEHSPDDGAFVVTVDGRATQMDVVCFPNSLVVSEPAQCTATVTDVDPSGTPSAPTGAVGFSSNGPGAFAPSSSCALSPVGPAASTCSLAYTPTAVGSGLHQVTGSYTSTDVHDPSGDSDVLSVSARATSTSIVCAPASVGTGQVTTCTATVVDTEAEGTASAPIGEVAFSSSGAGGFTPSAICQLGPDAADSSSCSLSYTPQQSGAQQIAGAYPGDAAHGPSQGSAALEVIPPPLTIRNLRLVPRSFVAGAKPTPFGPIGAAARGTSIRFLLSEPAKVRFIVFSRPRRPHPKHKPRHPVKAFVRALSGGPQSIRFSGRLPGRRFKAGRYRLVALGVTADGRRSKRAWANFRILRP